MAKTTFAKLNLKPNYGTTEVKLNDTTTLDVRTYLPLVEKSDLISFIVGRSLDDRTGCFSPVRTEAFFSVGLAKWYGNIVFTDKQLQDIGKTYDTLETNGVFDAIVNAIPKEELEFLQELVRDTISDISRYNASFAGTMSLAAGEASGLNEEATKLLEAFKNREGLEALSAVKDMVGTD